MKQDNTVDGPKNACSSKWCTACANREKREREEQAEMKHRGRHVTDPRAGRGQDRDLPTAALKEPAEEMITGYVVYGEPGQVPDVQRNSVPLSRAHPLLELTGSISSVQLVVHGDGSTYLRVDGYSLSEARAQWDVAAATIGGFRLNAFEAPAPLPTVPVETQVICANCGNLLEAQAAPDSAVYLHEDGSSYCPGASGSAAYPVRLGLHTPPSIPVPQPTQGPAPAPVAPGWEHATRVDLPAPQQTADVPTELHGEADRG